MPRKKQPVFKYDKDRFQWVEVEPGRKILVDTKAEPVEQTRRRSYVGEVHQSHEEERYEKLYHEKMLVCEDLKDKAARREWSRYKILPDGREGPLPFRSKAERREYCSRFGFRESGAWS